MKFFAPALSVYFCAHAAAGFSARTSIHHRTLASVPLHSVATEVAGEAATESFRLKFKEGDKDISPWHDIPLQNEDGSYNMVRILCSCN